MKKSVLIALMIFAMLATQTAVAQDEDDSHDVLEFSIYSGVGLPISGLKNFQDSLGAELGWGLGFDLGYFVSSSFVLGLNFRYTQFGIESDVDLGSLKHKLYNPNLYAKLYFQGETDWEPFLTAFVGLENPKFTTATVDRYREISYDVAVSVGGGLGIFYFTSDYSGLFLQANYRHAFTVDSKGSHAGVEYFFNQSVDQFEIFAGIRLLVGSDE